MIMSNADDTSAAALHKTWHLSEDGSQARCEPVEKLLEFLATHESDEDLAPHANVLTRHTRESLAACPSLTSWGQVHCSVAISRIFYASSNWSSTVEENHVTLKSAN